MQQGSSFTYEAGGIGCAKHPHQRRTSSKALAQWILFAFVALCLLVFPVLYAVVASHASLVVRLVPPVTFTVLLIAWMLGRPIAVFARGGSEAPYDGVIGVSVVIPCCNCADTLAE